MLYILDWVTSGLLSLEEMGEDSTLLEDVCLYSEAASVAVCTLLECESVGPTLLEYEPLGHALLLAILHIHST